ncbi:MAG: ATP-dependent DNA helicase RecG [Holosporales bacterium]|nr:ATP-dependent DNA helicase RecG [Holosporales bacterium]
MEILDGIEECLKWTQGRVGLFKKLMGDRIIDALLHIPSSVISKIYACPPSKNDIGKIVITKVRINCVEQSLKRSRRPSIIFCKSREEQIEILLFNCNYIINKVFPIGSDIIISGKLIESTYSKVLQFINPEIVKNMEDCHSGFFNIYPLTAGISQNAVRFVIKNALKCLKTMEITEWLPEKFEFISFAEALEEVHNPKVLYKYQLESNARKRLCFDELLAEQITIRLSNPKNKNGILIKNSRVLFNKLLESLPFALTHSQNKAINEIFSDMESGKVMERLMQGDVGTGKTIVAISSALNVIESGYQCAILVPTEILAQQHFKTVKSYIKEQIDIELLTGSDKGKRRKEIIQKINDGQTKILIGTHAIINNQINFQNLGLVIIDEQHRFGVEQRLQLITKGQYPHVLSMTATPIPRTMILSWYGDISVSSITEKPYGRKEIITKAIPIDQLDNLINGISKVVLEKRKVYWICPLIDESSKTEYTCVTNRLAYLKTHFKKEVQMLHGRMKISEKDDIFQKFKNGEFHILVSTTVIEVGLDVPDATVIIIENAEKFGLAQLHQLRGRVGRGSLQSFCILLFDPKQTSKIAMERIKIMRESNDGFYIAEKDLLLRGGGEILGTRQSGIKKYRTFDNDDPQSQQDIYDILKQASSLAAQIEQTNTFDRYDLLLKIFSFEKYKTVKKSF